jgi:hypothetical protein
LAENSAGSGIFHRGGAPAPATKGQLDETASFVLDDLDFLPGQVESPSQISQGTVSVASELEDTLAGVPAVRRVQAARPATPTIVPPTASRSWPKALAAIVVAILAAAAWAIWFWHLF